MTNCIFYAIVFVMFITFTTGSIRYMGVNRTFMSIYKGVFEASSISVGNDGKPITPYYDQKVLITYVNDYLDDNLTRYVTNYDLDIVFINKEDFSICNSTVCRDVKLTLKTEINAFFSYEKTQCFSIFTRYEL